MVNTEITIKGGVQNKFNFTSDDSLLNESEIDFGIGMALSETINMMAGIKFSVAGEESFSYNLRINFEV